MDGVRGVGLCCWDRGGGEGEGPLLPREGGSCTRECTISCGSEVGGLVITIPPPRTEWEEAKTEVGRETAARMEGATVTVGMVAAKLPPPLARMTAAAAVTEEEGGKLAREGTSGVWNKAEKEVTNSKNRRNGGSKTEYICIENGRRIGRGKG